MSAWVVTDCMTFQHFSLFSLLQKKHTRLVEQIRQSALQNEGQESGSEPEHEDYVSYFPDNVTKISKHSQLFVKIAVMEK